MIVSFTEYVPAPRYDNTPWTQVTIEESSSKTGPWILIDTQPLSPVDADPANPAARDFTTDQAVIPSGWYKVSFVDAAGHVLETDSIQNVPGLEFRPTIQDVAKICLARTRDANGAVLGNFTDMTVPTGGQVDDLITEAVNDLRPRIGTDIPDDLIPEAQHIVSLRTAMYIELTYFSNEVAQDRSPYPQYKELYDEKVPLLISAIQSEEAGLDITDAVSGNPPPSYYFPEPLLYLTYDRYWG
jgi:hypothetical protein